MLNFSQNVSTVTGGVHGHRAIVLLLPYISTVDCTADTEQLHFCMPHMCAVGCGRCPSVHVCRPARELELRFTNISFLMGLCPIMKRMSETSGKSFQEMKGDVGMSLHEKEREEEDPYTKTQIHS